LHVLCSQSVNCIIEKSDYNKRERRVAKQLLTTTALALKQASVFGSAFCRFCHNHHVIHYSHTKKGTFIINNIVTNNKIKLEIEIDAEEWEWFRANCAHFKGPNEEEQEAYALGLLEKAALKAIFEHKIYLAQQQIQALH
jgi:hypothetical protein